MRITPYAAAFLLAVLLFFLPADTAEEPAPPCVIMYHLIREEVYGDFPELFVRPTDFEKQLSVLKAAGYCFLFADEYADRVGRSVIITLDDGYDDNYTNLLPLLEAYDARATVFLVTDAIGTPGHLSPEQIKAMHASGRIRFGLHTASHADLCRLDDTEIRAEMQASSDKFVRIVGERPTVMAYPYGRYDRRVAAICAEYVSLAYTTEYPPLCKGISRMNIPRYTVSRRMTIDEFRVAVGVES